MYTDLLILLLLRFIIIIIIIAKYFHSLLNVVKKSWFVLLCLQQIKYSSTSVHLAVVCIQSDLQFRQDTIQALS